MRHLACGAIAATVALTGAAAAQDTGRHGEPLLWSVQVERLERRWTDGTGVVAWEGEAFAGGDEHKLRLKAEGQKPDDRATEEAEFQLLYSRMVSDFWDLQAGLRYDVRPEPRTSYAVFGAEGLAPYFIETEAHAFLSEDGDVTGRAEAEFDLLVTQRLVLQPAAEFEVALQDVEELGIGAGPSSVELSFRLRYELAREFAPYVGVHWERKLGETASIARREGEETDTLSVLAGLRFWF